MQGDIDPVPFIEHGNSSRLIGSAASLLIMVVFGLVLSASCGSDRERLQSSNSTAATQPPDIAPQAIQTSPEALQLLIPCHIDLATAQGPRPAVEPTPETIRIQLLERPYRIVPKHIVLKQNRWYRFVITTGSEWHSFRVWGMGLRVDYEIPPESEIAPLVNTTNVGVFPMVDWRHRRIMLETSAITVVPDGASPSTWNASSCGTISVHSPALDAQVSTPFVVEGSVTRPADIDLNVARIEAWSNGEQVGSITEDQFLNSGTHSDFLLTIPTLPAGSHTLLLQAILRDGTISTTVFLPIAILPDPLTGASSRNYRGNIDLPIEEGLQSLPVSVQGWAVIPGSNKGTGVGAIEVWNGTRETGEFLTRAVYGTYRPDVAQELGDPRFASSGFIAYLPDLPAGTVDLHIYVRDRQTGEYATPRFLESPLTRRISLAEGKVADASWPVALAPAPDGRLFFAELLTGKIRILQDGQVLPEPFAVLENVSNFGESGFLGLALHPDFSQTPYVYAMYVVDDPITGYPNGQRVVRFRDVNNIGQDRTTILDGLPAATEYSHNGGRLAFGPDGKLYVTIGDTDVPDLSQDPKNLAGSILRFNPDGSIPDDNPYPGSPVYAIGLRNVFGLAFQPETGYLYATENGPGGFDEVNKIEAAHNYGWPGHLGKTEAEGFMDPMVVYGNWPEMPIGPTGAAFADARPDLFLFCAYHDFFLRAVRLTGPEYDTVESTTVLSNNCAMDVAYSNDGWLYYSTLSAIYRARLDDLLLLYEQSAQ